MIDLRLPAVDVAPQLLGAVIRHTAVLADGTRGEVGIRLTEVEAYMGLDDPASHAFGGPTPRSAVMFGPPGHIYVYLSYGIHRCMNIVCSPDGQASAVLLRAGEVVIGKDLARARRSARAAARGLPAARPLPARRLASGPGNLGQALGAELTDSGAPLSQAAGASPAPDGSLWTLEAPASPADHVTSTRIGISRNAEKPWRFAHPRGSHRLRSQHHGEPRLAFGRAIRTPVPDALRRALTFSRPGTSGMASATPDPGFWDE